MIINEATFRETAEHFLTLHEEVGDDPTEQQIHEATEAIAAHVGILDFDEAGRTLYRQYGPLSTAVMGGMLIGLDVAKGENQVWSGHFDLETLEKVRQAFLSASEIEDGANLDGVDRLEANAKLAAFYGIDDYASMLLAAAETFGVFNSIAVSVGVLTGLALARGV